MNPIAYVLGALALLWVFSGEDKEKPPGEIKKVDPKKPVPVNSKDLEATNAGIYDAKVTIGTYAGLPVKLYAGSYKEGETTDWKAMYRSAFLEYLDKSGYYLDEDGLMDKKDD